MEEEKLVVPDDEFSMQAKITSQQSTIKLLKKSGTASAQQIADGVAILLDLRAKLAEMLKTSEVHVEVFNRKSFDELILRKMYVVPSFEIHNGPAGLFDYGPPACALKSNVLLLWRQFFALEENMLEMECTNLTPSVVLETSGHVERFTDFMVKDEKTGECFRADKLLEEVIDTFLEANPLMLSEEQESHRIIQVGTNVLCLSTNVFIPGSVICNS
jgi:glycyl-tRNA synthetase